MVKSKNAMHSLSNSRINKIIYILQAKSGYIPKTIGTSITQNISPAMLYQCMYRVLQTHNEPHVELSNNDRSNNIDITTITTNTHKGETIIMIEGDPEEA